MKIKTSELEGAALDLAVGIAINGKSIMTDIYGVHILGRSIWREVEEGRICPSTDWSQGGPLIDELVTVLVDSNLGGEWYAECSTNMHGRPLDEFDGKGPSALIAAMRAIVASEIGDEVDVPDDLMEVVS